MTEHICPDCGAVKEYDEYHTDPRFEVDKLNEREGGEGVAFVVVATIAVNLNEHFKCDVCGYVTYFDDELVETDIEMSGEVPEGKRMTVESAERDILRDVRDEYDVEDYL